MPQRRKQWGHTRDSLRPHGLSQNTGLTGVPGLNKTGGWSNPAFPFICQVVMEMRDSGVELTEETMDAAIKIGSKRHREHLREAAGRPPVIGGVPHNLPRPPKESVVYYVRRAEFVKIGTTVRLKERMSALAPDEILAIEPGSYELEKQLHTRFARLRAPFMREYFRMEKPLMDHIAGVVKQHGAPPAGLLTFGET